MQKPDARLRTILRNSLRPEEMVPFFIFSDSKFGNRSVCIEKKFQGFRMTGISCLTELDNTQEYPLNNTDRF
jgi:hypothetical protein